MKIMEEDNEENALLCVRILFDLHKSYRPSLKQFVPRFLEFVQHRKGSILDKYFKWYEDYI